jgi:predicted flap endonuclease-1-like 5' DNA nuclease
MAPVISVALIIILGLAIGFIIASGLGMNPIIGLLLVVTGAIVGFIAEWIIDESLRKNRELRRQLAEQKNEPISAQAAEAGQLDGGRRPDAETLTEVLRQHNDELHQLSEQILAKDGELESLRRKFDAYQTGHPDELTHLKGIGPVYQRKLRDAGFSSFQQLAAANPAQIRRMLDIKNWQRADIEAWVQQAKDWAGHR